MSKRVVREGIVKIYENPTVITINDEYLESIFANNFPYDYNRYEKHLTCKTYKDKLRISIEKADEPSMEQWIKEFVYDLQKHKKVFDESIDNDYKKGILFGIEGVLIDLKTKFPEVFEEEE